MHEELYHLTFNIYKPLFDWSKVLWTTVLPFGVVVKSDMLKFTVMI